MIYFLDNSLQLQKIVTSKNINSAIHEHELNGLIRGDIELDLSYANKFLVLGIDHVGYYYKNEFYLHKIQRVEYDHVNETALVVLRHVFFEDMIFGKLIQDVRPQNQDALFVLNQTIDANTRWQTVMTDVTGRLSTNFYWQVPYEVIEFVTENYRVEYIPKILFDGQKINGFQLHVANKVGEDKNIRIPFGSRVLDLKYEEDYSEIITKLVGHGKGEEVGDGYGRRINIADVNFSKNGVESPLGDVYMEDETVTATYGNDGQTPREGRVIFEDIENVNELAQATYEHYLQVSRPQMLFTADVADIGDVDIGDSVMIIRREYDVYFKARIHKLTVDLLYPEDAQVELGDYEHFKESKIARKTREKNNRLHKRNQSLIEQAKRDFDERFNSAVEQFRSEFEQAKIDIFAEIEADRENMQNLLDTKSAEWTENFNQSVAESKEYAEQQAQEKADKVRTDLETVTSGHQTMLQELENSVINIDDFLGDSRSVTLDERFQDITMNFEERIRNIDSTHFNMIRGTSFDNPELMSNQASVEIITNETDNFARLGLGTTNVPFILPNEYFHVEQGQKYHLVFTYRTNDVPEIDYAHLRPPSGYGGDLIIEEQVLSTDLQTVMTGQWSKKVYTFVSDRSMPVRLLLGTNFGAGNTQRGILDIKKPYLTTTNNREWLPHPDDDMQNVSEIVRRVTLLEDGRSELITRSEYDFETGQLGQYIKSVEETVEGNKTVLQRVENWQATNGASIEETIYGFNQKVWLNDVANIGANLIPMSANAWEDGLLWLSSGSEGSVDNDIRLIENIPVDPSTDYVFRDYSTILSRMEYIRIFEYSADGTMLVNRQIERGNRSSFNTHSNTSSIRISLIHADDLTIPTSFIESRDNRIQMKLERGSVETPIINALSNVEQIANSIRMQVQELDGKYLSQSDLQITPNYWQFGSTRIGAENVSSVLRGSPDALDAVVSNFNLTGNLNAKGQITTLAVDAIEGNFARLFANQLTANIITSDHIQVGTALVDKMFATSARIDELITKTHFVNNIKAMSVEAVEGQFSTLFTRYLNANYIDADYIVGKNAWFETQYVKTSNISKLTSQTAFIRDVQAIEITANQLNIQTLHSKLRSVEGGLTIYGPDGRVFINNSVLRASFDVQLIDFMTSAVTFTGQNYMTSSSNYQTFKAFYTDFKGSKLLVSWAFSLQGPSASEYVQGRIRGFGNNNPIGSWSTRHFVSQNGTVYHNQVISLGVPDYSTIQAYLELRRDPNGSNPDNTVRARVLRVSLID